MKVLRSPKSVQSIFLRFRRQGRLIGLVPTMGYLHEGHMSLVREARKRVGPRGCVVVTIYVNPTQFAAHEDLSKYPRDLPRDLTMCRNAGVDIVVCPNDTTMYPGKSNGRYSTYVVEENLVRTMEGVSRPTHFRGVTTVVAKLFNLTLPDVAVFGAKDWQQAAVIRRMTDDLNFPIRIVVASTVRESDGLAMSSRNKYLSTDERSQATVLIECLRNARQWVRARPNGMDPQKLRVKLTELISQRPSARLDYVEFFHPTELTSVEVVTKGTHLALAVYVGKTRLIDNGRL